MPVFRNRFLSLVIFTDFLFTAISFAALNHFSPAQIIPCTDIWADHLILALILAFASHLVLAPILLPGRHKFFLAVPAALILFIFWLGVYSISPLGYSKGRIPNLRGFFLITASRSFTIANKEIVSLGRGASVSISPLMLAGKFQCDWMSSAGAMFDNPSDCDTTYRVPDADHDILQVHIRSNCGLPDSIGQIKIGVLP